MFFNIMDDGEGGSTIQLDMSYEPTSPVATLALPVLTLDNFIALNVLLQDATDTTSKLDKYRNLMGLLYGIAGVAHLFDCLIGGSFLLKEAGIPDFFELPLNGMGLAILWCLSGPISFACSKAGGRVADLGLVQYGLIEVGGAALAANYYGGGAFPNAIGVQLIVALAWLYTRSQQTEAA